MHHKKCFFIRLIEEDGTRYYGECGLFQGLSHDDRPEYEKTIRSTIRAMEHGDLDLERLRDWPSIRFGFETLIRHWKSEDVKRLFDNDFTMGKPIPINGLVWMGDRKYMQEQIETKLQDGFNCVKIKIGAIDWEDELALLHSIRSRFPSERIMIRVDANGAFHPDEAPSRLEQLSILDVHSIEQPIAAGQWEEMRRICRNSPIPIALDEELIGINDLERKEELIQELNPQYIILKPSLHGGFSGSDEWVSLAEGNGIGWWATSALESNIGLNAITQWVSSRRITGHQGLGTGELYQNNIPSPLRVEKGHIRYMNGSEWHYDILDDGDWLHI